MEDVVPMGLVESPFVRTIIRTFIRRIRAASAVCIGLLVAGYCAGHTAATPDNPDDLITQGDGRNEALRIHERIYQAEGFGNTFLVTTREGNVVIDTSVASNAPRHKAMLQEIDNGPTRYIILTHGHGDHKGGVPVWAEPDTEVIAQQNHVEFLHYRYRLGPYFRHVNSAQFGPSVAQEQVADSPPNYGAPISATMLFDEQYSFSLGDLTFELYHTPGETPDHLTVWIPELRAAFVGDNFYGSFPNIYTLRGTRPRSALDYVNSLDRVLAFDPAILLPSHGLAIQGAEEIRRRVSRYRNSILHVHDQTVKGMNEGKDVHTLMRTVSLPNELDVGESYGKVAWSVRGIYEGYVGWFHGDPADLYPVPPSAISSDLVELAGGADVIAGRAGTLVEAGRYVEALRLTGIALDSDPGSRGNLKVRLEALSALRRASTNSNESGWLDWSIRNVEASLQAP